MLLFWPLIVIILIIGLLSFFTVQTAQVAVITRFGKFLRVAEPGLNWKWPFIDRVAGRGQLARQSDHADHGDQDQGQRLRHDSDFGAEPRSP
jgi:regulator of protease activity HflC (stomatin/prohibitin superfamily)